jgi:hypothetical protein
MMLSVALIDEPIPEEVNESADEDGAIEITEENNYNSRSFGGL